MKNKLSTKEDKIKEKQKSKALEHLKTQRQRSLKAQQERLTNQMHS
jgi:hypothetical protein